jgi:hypothetical protein
MLIAALTKPRKNSGRTDRCRDKDGPNDYELWALASAVIDLGHLLESHFDRASLRGFTFRSIFPYRDGART